MRNCLKFLLIVFGVNILSAQNMTVEQLIQKWNKDDLTQTIEAEKTYTDLKLHYNQSVFNNVVCQINEYLKKESNPRMEIRLEMYKILQELGKSNIKLSKEREKDLRMLFQKVALLKDPQILSELYSLYAENSTDTFENNLFYIIKTIEIQEEIGTQYFPKFYLRMFFAGLSHYNLTLYKESIHYTKKSLENLKTPTENLGIYILNLDLIGSSYYKLNQTDSSVYYYHQIHKELETYNLHYKDYKEGFQKYNSPFFNIWMGISQGGIGRGMIAEKKYREAIPYLEYNIHQSQAHHQLNDLAKAQNLLAEAYSNLGNPQKALIYSRTALKNATASNTVKEIIPATTALEKHFKDKGRFDSAYFYSEKKHFYQREMHQVINQSKFLSVTNRLNHEKMEQTIAQAEDKIIRQNHTRNSILIISVLLLAILLILYHKYRQQQEIKLLKLSQKSETAEKNYLESQKKIKEANLLLNQFRHKLKQNNHLIETIKTSGNAQKPDISELQSTTILTKEDWLNFRKQFNKVYPNYYNELREVYPELSPAEIRYLCLVKLNLRQNEIASTLGVSDSSVRVTWHRMRKKLDIQKINPEEFLKKFEVNQNITH